MIEERKQRLASVEKAEACLLGRVGGVTTDVSIPVDSSREEPQATIPDASATCLGGREAERPYAMRDGGGLSHAQVPVRGDREISLAVDTPSVTLNMPTDIAVGSAESQKPVPASGEISLAVDTPSVTPNMPTDIAVGSAESQKPVPASGDRTREGAESVIPV